MAHAHDPAPQPNLEIYDFETDFETGFKSAVTAHSEDLPAASGDNGKLLTPRIECEFLSGAQVQRSYVVSGTNTGNTTPPTPWRYPNEWGGNLKVNIATNRLKDGGIKAHRRCRALVRWLSQNHEIELSARMKYLTIIQVLESGTSREFRTQNDEDISGLSFQVRFNIHPSAFPTPN